MTGNTAARILRLVSAARAREGCNSVELHVTRGTTPAGALQEDHGGGGCARLDLARDDIISMMRSALGSRALSACSTTHCRLQSSHLLDMTMECRMRTHSRTASKTSVESGTLLGVCDMRGEYGLPLVWLDWHKQRLRPEAFPCVMQRHDVRCCVRREISCGDGVTLLFETHTDGHHSPLYRAWVHVHDLRDPEAAVAGVTRALDAIGVTG